MPGGRKKPPPRSCRSRFAHAADEEEDRQVVEEPPSRGEEPPLARRLSRRLQFQETLEGGTSTTTTTTRTTRTGDGGTGGGDEDEDEDEDEEDEDGGHDDWETGASSGSRKPYQRGPASLPDPRPLPGRRPVIRPVGTASWKFVSGADGSRHINGIQGLLIREYYPGFVIHNGEEKPPMKWEHFYSVISNGETLAAKIKRELWDFFTCEEGKEQHAARVQEAVCKLRLKDLYHEARLQCVITYCANVLGQVVKKPQVREMFQQRETDLTEEQYVQMCPEWCDKYQDCWLAIVRIWRSDASYEQHRERRRRRLQMQGAPHHQGNRSLPQYIEKWSQAHGGQDCNEMMGYALSHKGRATAPDNVYDEEDGPDAYTNSSVYPKIDAYRRAFRQRHGETSDPATEPLDTDLLMRLGPGKQHGSYMMANSAIDPSSAPTLREIRRGGSSSSSDIPIAPRQPSSAQMFSQFQEQIAQMQAYQEAQEARQEALRQQQEALHQQQMLALSQHYQRQLTDLTGYFRSQMPGTDEPPASLFAPPEVPLSAPAPAPVPFPAQSAGSNPTPGASPPLGPSPPYQAYPTYPTQPYMYPPPSQGYSSWPPFPTQQGHSGPASVTAPQNRWNYGTSSQSGWRLYEHGGGSGTPGDDAQS